MVSHQATDAARNVELALGGLVSVLCLLPSANKSHGEAHGCVFVTEVSRIQKQRVALKGQIIKLI